MNAGPDPRAPRYRGRFAPSPTGPLHFGSLVAAMASYCDARAAGGEWLLRIEDVDLPRSRPGAVRSILASLERCGFAWDGEVVRQSGRTAQYASALARIRVAGLVYECACTRSELAGAPLGAGGERVYPGTCRDGIAGTRVARCARATRVRVGDARIGFRDRLHGEFAQDLARDVGDFVVRRADGLYAYQLAVVVDDAEQGVTDVVRGADLLPSTPRQILLQRMLGHPVPSYLHVPVAVDGGGEKLSKQTLARTLPDDVLPTLLAAWRFLGQHSETGSARPASIDEFWSTAVASWRVDRLPPALTVPAPAPFGGRAGGKV